MICDLRDSMSSGNGSVGYQIDKLSKFTFELNSDNLNTFSAIRLDIEYKCLYFYILTDKISGFDFYDESEVSEESNKWDLFVFVSDALNDETIALLSDVIKNKTPFSQIVEISNFTIQNVDEIQSDAQDYNPLCDEVLGSDLMNFLEEIKENTSTIEMDIKYKYYYWDDYRDDYREDKDYKRQFVKKKAKGKK